MATVIQVTNINDSGAGSLRNAIATAQSGDTIQFSTALANQKITLTGGSLNINGKALTIDASGAAGLTVSGNNTTRVFDIQGTNPNVTLKNFTIADGRATPIDTSDYGHGGGIRTGMGATLTLDGMTFNNNYAAGTGGGAVYAGYKSTNTVINSTFEGNSTAGKGLNGTVGERGGGAIAVHSESSLTVDGSTFNNNSGINGGAINSLLSTLTVTDSTFTNNDTTAGGNFGPDTRGYGGAIYTDGAHPGIADSIRISNSRFDGNKGAGQGGALFLYAYGNAQDTAIVENSTIVNNTVVKDTQNLALGGGIRMGGGGSLTLTNTTLANNRAYTQGGGLWAGDTSVTMTNSTFYGNRAESADGTQGLGGAMLIQGQTPATISDSTIANNYAGFQGGAFWGGSNAVTLSNTLVSDNQANNGGNTWNIYHNTGTTYTDGGGNVEYNPHNTNDTKVVPGVTVIDPQLGTFTDNGGFIQTPPEPGNTAVTAGATASGNITATAPLAPDSLVAAASSDTEIALAWNDNSNNEAGFKIERSLDNTNWTEVGTAGANTNSYTDTGLNANTQYYYRLSAINGVGTSTTIDTSSTTTNTGTTTPIGGGGTTTPINNPTDPGNAINPTDPTKAINPTLVKNSNGIFEFSGGNLRFTLNSSQGQGVNEIGVFAVEDDQGTVNGVNPGDPNYTKTALTNGKVIFSALPNLFPDIRNTRQLSFDKNTKLGFYLVQNSSTDQVLAGGSEAQVFFATAIANNGTNYLQAADLGNSSFRLAWEDRLGGSVDFRDVEMTIEASNAPLVTGTYLQGNREGELLDLSNHTGTLSAEFIVNSEAAYDNHAGLYAVDDASGRIGNLNPGDAGYAEAAIAQRLDPAAGLPGGKILAPFMIADSTPEEFLAKNPKNQAGQGPMAYFAFLGANPDKVDHVRQIGDNTFAFEDVFGGGDFDYNDHVVQVNLA
jgi:predicted outer membrane repeat protein